MDKPYPLEYETQLDFKGQQEISIQTKETARWEEERYAMRYGWKEARRKLKLMEEQTKLTDHEGVRTLVRIAGKLNFCPFEPRSSNFLGKFF